MLPVNHPQMNIELTAAAFEQIDLMATHDYTLEGMNFRLKIGGKGCDGFTYETGFSLPLPDDLELTYLHNGRELKILLDKFTAHYCSSGVLDYLFDIYGEEGFTFSNKREHLYHGKFFSDPSLLPPTDEQA